MKSPNGDQRSRSGPGPVPLLVVSSEVLSCGLPDGWIGEWNGQRVVVELPTATSVADAGDGWIVFECLEPPVSTLRLLCGVMRRIPHIVDAVTGPILFVAAVGDGLPSMNDLAGGTIVHARTRDGQLSMLALGSEVASNPLLADFFAVMDDHEVDVDTFLELLAAIQLPESA